MVLSGSAADLCKLAMVRSVAQLRESRVDFKLLLQIHDELVFHVRSEQLDQAAGIAERFALFVHIASKTIEKTYLKIISKLMIDANKTCSRCHKTCDGRLRARVRRRRRVGAAACADICWTQLGTDY